MTGSSASAIHPTAIVDPKAELGEGVSIGPYSIVGPQVRLDDGVELHAHVVVAGRTRIGARTRIFPFASIGSAPQDLKFKDEPSELVIGSDNTIREHVTMNPGTEGGGMLTQIGDGCLFMVGSHVGHDCRIGNRVILANNATLGGHVTIEDHAILGGLSAVHQFCRIGQHVMVGGMTGVEHDVVPYAMVMGNRAWISGLNLIGLKRRGFGRETIRALRDAYALLFAEDGTWSEHIGQVAERYADDTAVRELIDFVQQDSSRGFCRPQAEGKGNARPGDDS